MRQRLEEFCRNNPGAQKIIHSLGNSAAIKLRILPDTDLLFRKAKGGLELTAHPSVERVEIDMDIVLPAAMLEDFLAAAPQTADAIILFFAENYYHEKYRPYIELKILSGVFRLTMKGYLGLIPLGGPALMSILRSKGFGSIGAITTALKGIARK
ncbi:MAG TPA: hypothetical protein PLV42_05230 [bacterium]|nr:hypothetical protein [bacterium]